MSHQITFEPSGRGKAQCAADPRYPSGIAIDGSTPNAPSCLVLLPYPAPECGLWMVGCDECGLLTAITAAGRPDDPISVKMNCKAREAHV